MTRPGDIEYGSSDPAGVAGEGFVREPVTGKLVFLQGYGALRGLIELDPRIDLTKPIYEQVLRLKRARRGRTTPAGNP